MYGIYVFMCMVAMVFYYYQNNNYLAGGKIALAKLVWLGYAILYWFVIPLVVSTNKNVPEQFRRIYRIFFLVMMARAVCELIMMYSFKNWNPYYGIAHDVFSILILSFWLLSNLSKTSSGIMLHTIYVMLAMLVVEIYFVQYMLSNVKSDDIVYFVPLNEKHDFVLTFTSFINAMLTVYLYVFTRKWNDEYTH